MKVFSTHFFRKISGEEGRPLAAYGVSTVSEKIESSDDQTTDYIFSSVIILQSFNIFTAILRNGLSKNPLEIWKALIFTFTILILESFGAVILYYKIFPEISTWWKYCLLLTSSFWQGFCGILVSPSYENQSSIRKLAQIICSAIGAAGNVVIIIFLFVSDSRLKNINFLIYLSIYLILNNLNFLVNYAIKPINNSRFQKFLQDLEKCQATLDIWKRLATILIFSTASIISKSTGHSKEIFNQKMESSQLLWMLLCLGIFYFFFRISLNVILGAGNRMILMICHCIIIPLGTSGVLILQEKLYNNTDKAQQKLQIWEPLIGVLLICTSNLFSCCYLYLQDYSKTMEANILFFDSVNLGFCTIQNVSHNLRKFILGQRSYVEFYKAPYQSSSSDKNTANDKSRKKAKPTKIYICPTFYRENQEEMEVLLKSLQRVYNSKDNGNLYEFEVHLWFDQVIDLKNEPQIMNNFVHDLIDVLKNWNFVAKNWYGTPYGMRLEYEFPVRNTNNNNSGNDVISRFYVHLKDQRKIQHGKRWSQTMYMYYLMNHKEGYDGSNVEQHMKTIANLENRFILALDADVNFGDKDVRLCLKKSNEDQDIAICCGRIKPTGYGPIVAYQRFEYACGHWLQKACEDILGVVLCSPGHRGRGDDNAPKVVAYRF